MVLAPVVAAPIFECLGYTRMVMGNQLSAIFFFKIRFNSTANFALRSTGTLLKLDLNGSKRFSEANLDFGPRYWHRFLFLSSRLT